MQCAVTVQIPTGPLMVKDFSDFVVIRLGEVHLFVSRKDVGYLVDAAHDARAMLCLDEAKELTDGKS